MDWVWFLFAFDGRINRAKAWLALLVILCWMIFIAGILLFIDGMFGNPVKSVHFNLNDVFAFVDPAVLHVAIARLREGKEASPAHLVVTFFHTAGTLLFAWVYLATSVKRLHDRNRSGWWVVPFFVAPGLYAQFADRLPDSTLMFPLALTIFALMIWGFVEIYCLKGTRWTNQFGPNPLPKEQTRPRSSRSSSAGWDQTSSIELVPHSAGSPANMHVKRGA
ncbi:MAG TPA: DUF805 domain-containing protein [Bradyrhizobium sp.]|uniref:DUF805 domain-containing protein n=1 Tax=Bradyrhizobium sp. TaxID=376 RepID=UPI002D806ABE|nr:DUF805 domain-containing protein [Bradyrhizobium sp.]HET7885758.1 DUF805 domain-containing protein [Bradyrhizobium sp.]